MRKTALLPARPRLLAHVLLYVVQPPSGLAGASRALPPAEWLNAGPCAGRGTRTAVDVHHPCLDVAQEPVDLRLVSGEEPGAEAQVGRVGQGHSLCQRIHWEDGDERDEELVPQQPVVGGQAGPHGWRPGVSAPPPLASAQHLTARA